MTDTPTPGPQPGDSLPTEPLHLADQQPVAPAMAAAPPAPAKSSHRTVLAVVGGVVAVGLIALSGIVGFALGHFTADRGDHVRLTAVRGPAEGQQGRGPGQGGGQQGFGGPGMMPGQGQQGLGGGPGMMPGQGPLPGQGVDPRGIDPDGDNWTGGGQGTLPGQGTTPTTPTDPQGNATPSGA